MYTHNKDLYNNILKMLKYKFASNLTCIVQAYTCAGLGQQGDSQGVMEGWRLGLAGRLYRWQG